MLKLLLFAFSFLVGLSVNSQNLNANHSMDSGTSGVLSVSFVTSDPGGIWDPENVLAVWVQDSSGKLMNTMMVYTSNTWNSAQAMSEWWSVIGSRWSDDFSELNAYAKLNADGITGATQVDGISGATRPMSEPPYGHRYCYWGVSENLNAVPDGTYTIKMEIANDVAAVGAAGHKVASFDFIKSRIEVELRPVNVLPSFKSIIINWLPDFTGLKSKTISDRYLVYPNPAKSFVFVDGFDIRHIELFTTTGKSVLKSKQQHVNLAALPAASYIMLIKTGKGLVSKKIIKY